MNRFPCDDPYSVAEWRPIAEPVCGEVRRSYRWKRVGNLALDALATLAIIAVVVMFSVVIFSGAGAQ